MPRFNHELLARVRTELNLTQEAAAAAVGVDVRTYRRYESGAVNEAAEGFVIRNASRRRLLVQLGRELGIAEDELVIADAPSTAALRAGWHTCHAHTLPRAPHFVGREDVLALLRGWARGRRAIAVVAIGGAGKTALIERFLAQLGDGPHAGGVFVWSFYDDTRVEAFFARATAYFAGTTEVAAGDRLEALQRALATGEPHLLVLDGLEVLQGSGLGDASYGRIVDGALRRLLTSMVRGLGAARLLLTSRFEPTDLQAWEGTELLTVRLGGLSRADGSLLLARWGLAGGETLEPLVDRVGGHALSVAMLGSYAGAFLGGDAERAQAIELEPAARDDVQARRLLAVLTAYAKCYRIHGALVRESGPLEAWTTSLRALAYTERLAGSLTEALGLTEAAAAVAREAAADGDVARALALKARVLHDLGRVDEADACFLEVRRLGDRPFARRSFWEAEHGLALGRVAVARAEVEGNLAGLRALGWAGHRAHAETILGDAALAGDEPDPDHASDHLAHAREWTAVTGEVEVVLRCQALAAKICLAERRFADADITIRSGLALSETCGFGLFAVDFNNLRLERALAVGAGGSEAATQALIAARARPAYAWGLADALHLAGLAALAEGGAGARALLGEAEIVRTGLRHPGLAATRKALARAGES